MAKNRSGAITSASHAGNDFHFAWAAHRLLEFLRPRPNLVKVTIEGASMADEKEVGNAAELLAIDATSYWGGADAATAARVEIDQFKYSPTNPAGKWTLARLVWREKSRGKDGNKGSVWSKLARAFAALVKLAPSGKVIARIATNQSLDEDVLEALSSIQVMPEITTWDESFERLQTVHKSIVTSLKKDSELSDSQFLHFVRSLDLLGFCSVSLRVIENRVMLGASASFHANPRSAASKLLQLVREAARDTGECEIQREDVLNRLGVWDEKRLFPSPDCVELPPGFDAPTCPNSRALAQAILQGHKRILVHAGAGIGKSTTLKSLQHVLGVDCHCVFYDCYGRGLEATRGFAEARFEAVNFYLQTGNSLAAEFDSPLVFEAADRTELCEHDFCNALNHAAHSVQKEGGRIVLLVDAADNAVRESKLRGHYESFVQRLWGMDLPDQVHLVMSARSHARVELKAPSDAHQIELEALTMEQSACHIRRFFPDVSDDEILLFHLRSKGVPRNQNYRLRRPQATIGSAIQEPGNDLDDFFADMVRDFCGHFPPPSNSQHFAEIVVSGGALRTADASKLWQTHEAGLLLALDALVPGIRVESGCISFGDEDFQHWAENRVLPDEKKTAHEKIGKLYLGLQSTDPHAATHVSSHLLLGRCLDELVDLAKRSPEPLAIIDPASRAKASRHRLRDAAIAAATNNNLGDCARMLVWSAEVARRHSGEGNLVREAPDLSLKFMDFRTVRQVLESEAKNGFERVASREWMCAANYASAKGHNDVALAWLKAGDLSYGRYRRTPKEKMPQHLRMKGPLEEDFANRSVAVFFLRGPEVAAKELQDHWKKKYRPRMAERLVEKLCHVIQAGDWKGLLTKCCPLRNGNANIVLRIVSTLWRSHRWAWDDAVLWLMGRLSCGSLPNEANRQWGEDDRSGNILDACEAAAFSRGDAAMIIEVLNRWGPAKPTDTHLDWYRLKGSNWTSFVRAKLLQTVLADKEVDLKEIEPAKDEGMGYSHCHNEAVASLHATVASERVRTSFLLGKGDLKMLKAEVHKTIQQLRQPVAHWDHHTSRDAVAHAGILIEVHRWCEPVSGEWMLQLAGAVMNKETDHSFLTKWAASLEGWELYPSIVDELLAPVIRYSRRTALDDSNARDLLVRAARLSRSPAAACEAFDAALEAAQRIGSEGQFMFSMITELCEDLGLRVSMAEGAACSLRLVRWAELLHTVVGGDQNFPDRDIMRAITALHPPMAVATVARWNEKGLGPHSELELLDEVAITGLRKKYFSAHEALALLIAGGQSASLVHGSAELIRLLDAGDVPNKRVQQREILRYATTALNRDCDPQSKGHYASILAEVASSCGIDSVDVSILRDLKNFGATKDVRAYQRTQFSEEQVKQAYCWNESPVLSQLDCGSEETQYEREQTMAARIGELPYVRRVELLDEILRADPATFKSHDNLLQHVAKALASWKDDMAVRAWCKQHLRDFAALCFKQRMFGDPRKNDHPIQHVEKLFESYGGKGDKRGLLEVMMQAISGWKEHSLMVGARWIACRMKPVEALQLFDELMGELELRWFVGCEEVNPARVSEIPSAEAIAGLFWSLQGHPWKYVRFEALYATIHLVRSGEMDVFHALASRAGLRDAGAYRSCVEGHHFFWLSARVFLWRLLRRVGADWPGALKPHAANLAAAILDKQEPPHALIRELARETLLKLDQSLPGVLAADVLQRIRLLNKPALVGPAEMKHVPFDSFIADGGLRFQFDWIDTLPYWFTPACRIFGGSLRDFCSAAECWICDRWHFTDKDVESDALAHASDYGDYHARSGDPKKEVLQVYLEYHSMMCVVGQWLDEGRMVAVDGLGGHAFDAWMRSEIGYDYEQETWTDEWLAPPPFEKEAWHRMPGVETWTAPIEDSAMDDLQKLGEFGSGWLLLDARSSVANHGCVGSSWLESGLVSDESASAFLAALLTYSSPSLTVFPDRSSVNGKAFKQPPFNFEALVKHVYHDPGWMKHDALKHQMVRYVPVLNRHFAEICELAPNRPFTEWKRNGEVAVIHQDWRSGLAIREDNYSHGRRIWVRESDMAAYLRRHRMALILCVHIQRHEADRSQRLNNHKKRRAERTEFRILRYNDQGAVLETLGGSRCLGSPNRRATRPASA